MHETNEDDWTALLRRYTKPLFCSCEQKLFVTWTERQSRAKQKRCARKQPTTSDENTDNSLHFLFPVGVTPEECFRENHALAEAIRVVWKSILDKQYRELRYTLFVSNEYEIVFDGETGRILSEEIRPTLRLWTYDPDTDGLMRATYRPDEAGPEKVFWRQRRAEGLFELREILRVIALPEGSPEKASLLERYYSQDRTLCFHLED